MKDQSQEKRTALSVPLCPAVRLPCLDRSSPSADAGQIRLQCLPLLTLGEFLSVWPLGSPVRLSCFLLPDMNSDQLSDFPGLSLCISGSPSPVFQLLTVSPWLSLACLPVLLCQKSIERRSQPVQMENCPSESTRDDLSEDLRCRTPCLRISPLRSCRRSCL